MRDSIVFYRSFYEAIKNLEPEDFKKSIEAIMEYGLNGIEMDLDGIAKTVFLLVKPQIEANNKRYLNGTKGGRPTKEKTKDKPNDNQTITKVKPNVNVNVNDNVNENDKDTLSGTSADHAPEYEYKAVIDYLNIKAGTKFMDKSKDTRKHIKARFDEGFTLDDFKNVIGKKVDEWKGTELEKFIRPSTLFGTKFESYLNQKIVRPNKNRFTNFDQRDYDFADLEKKFLEG